MLAGLLLAASCAAWHPAVAGFYRGTVESIGMKPIDTWITVAPGGLLAGRYVLHEGGQDVEGTLDPVGDEGCDTAVFRWTDLYGTGLARLTFYPERKCFEGAWGHEVILPRLVWHSCTEERVTS